MLNNIVGINPILVIIAIIGVADAIIDRICKMTDKKGKKRLSA